MDNNKNQIVHRENYINYSVKTMEEPLMADPDYSHEEWDKWYGSFLYERKCSSCEQSIKVKTQEDDCPEYYIDIFIECPNCKNDVQFTLPVN